MADEYGWIKVSEGLPKIGTQAEDGESNYSSSEYCYVVFLIGRRICVKSNVYLENRTNGYYRGLVWTHEGDDGEHPIENVLYWQYMPPFPLLPKECQDEMGR